MPDMAPFDIIRRIICGGGGVHLEELVAGSRDGHDEADALLELNLLQRSHVLLHQRAHPSIQLGYGRLRRLRRAGRDDAAVPAAAAQDFDLPHFMYHQNN